MANCMKIHVSSISRKYNSLMDIAVFVNNKHDLKDLVFWLTSHLNYDIKLKIKIYPFTSIKM